MSSVTISANLSKVTVSGTAISVAVAPAVSIVSIGSATTSIDAENVAIADAGNYYTSDNVEGALQEVGADLASLDGRLDTAETNITGLDGRLDTAETNISTLQNDVANIVEPSSGQGIVVDVGGAVNFGSDTDAGTQAAGTRYVRGAFAWQLKDPDTGNVIELDTETGNINGTSLSANATVSKRFESAKQTLAAVAGNVAWDMSLGNHATLTLTDTATLQNPTNLPASSIAIFPSIEVIQGGSGGYTLSFGSAYKFPSVYVAAGTALGSRTLYNFYLRSDGNLGVVSTYYAS